jgi:acetate---CoA ligase (ADP-forming)
MMNIDTMSLESLFYPQSIAIIGASERMNRIGSRPIQYLLDNGYNGNIYPINPKYDQIAGLPCYPDLYHVPEKIDLAILALPESLVMTAIKQCAEKKVKSVIIFSSGFAETGSKGRELQDQILQITQKHGMRVLGPNCLGMFNHNNGVYATFSVSMSDGAPIKGRIGLVTQSGAFGSHVITSARERHIGFSCWVSTGNEMDIDVADCIAYLADKDDIDVIACYIEGVKDGEKFLNALSLAKENQKPVVLLKSGRSEVGKEAVQSHTASLVGSDEVFDVVFKQTGVYRVNTIEEFLNISYACTMVPLPKGNNVGVFSVSGGLGIMIADQLIEHSMKLPEPSQNIKEELLNILPFAGVRNPFDITAQIINQPTLLRDFMDVVFSSQMEVDIAIVFLSHLGLSDSIFSNQLEILIEMKEKYPDQPCIVVTLTKPEIRKSLAEAGIFVCEDPTEAVKVVHALNYFRKKLSASSPMNQKWEQKHLDFSNSPQVLTEYKSKKYLKDYGIPCTKEGLAATLKEAILLAEEIGYPVVLKGMSADILHKTDSGLVHLKLGNKEDVKLAYNEIMKKMSEMGVNAEGVLVQEWVNCNGLEVIVGSKYDVVFGQMILVGLGGIFTEVFNDVSMRKAPVSTTEAEKMLRELRSYPLFQGYRNQHSLDISALSELVSQFSHFVTDHKDIISEIDLNPVIVHPKGYGVVTVDALITLNNSPVIHK